MITIFHKFQKIEGILKIFRYRKTQIKILEMKTLMSKIKITLDGIKNRLDPANKKFVNSSM